jgi:hypothetical protein
MGRPAERNDSNDPACSIGRATVTALHRAHALLREYLDRRGVMFGNNTALAHIRPGVIGGALALAVLLARNAGTLSMHAVPRSAE